MTEQPSRRNLAARPPKTDPYVDALRSAVSDRPPIDHREERAKAIFLAELDRLDRPFDEHTDLTHVTASGIVVGERGVILHMHRKLHRWLQPGGHVDTGESPEVAVLRECTEETGLACHHPVSGPVLIHVDVHEAAHGHIHLDARYLVLAPNDDPNPPPNESQQVEWFSWAEAQVMADEALAGALDSARVLLPPEIGHTLDTRETTTTHDTPTEN